MRKETKWWSQNGKRTSTKHSKATPQCISNVPSVGI
jgi:hypothetical protein